MKLFRILALGVMFSLIGGNTLLSSTGLKLADFTDTSTLPTEDTWIIIDSSAPLKDEFKGLKTALGKAERDNREIKLMFPNIVKIPRYAFYVSYQQSITSLVSVSASKATTIGDYAFLYCTALTEVNIPLATDIGDAAFAGCSALTEISLPKVINIGYQAFKDCDALTEVDFPNATDIGDYAFYGCSALTKVHIPLATTIGDYAFYGCSALTKVHIPLATYIGDYAFLDCSALITMIIATSSTLQNIDPNAFSGFDTSNITIITRAGANKNKFTDLNLDFKEILLIGGNTLLSSTGLKLADFTDTSRLPTEDTWIIIDNSGTTDDFRGLKIVLGKAEIENREIKLVFPNIVTIPREAFYTIDEQPIKSLISVSASKATYIGYYAFGNCSALAEVNIPKAIYIGHAAFWNSSALAEVNIPKVTTIGVSAFYDCDALTEINFPLATDIGDYAFGSCSALTEVNFPLATDIGDMAFLYCTALTEVNIPKATYIGEGAFSVCSSLTTMIIATSSTLENIDADAFVSPYDSSSSSTDTTKITVTTSHANKNADKFTGFDFKEVIGQ